VPEIWVYFVFVKCLLLLLRLRINQHSQFSKEIIVLAADNRQSLYQRNSISLGILYDTETRSLRLQIDTEMCAIQELSVVS